MPKDFPAGSNLSQERKKKQQLKAKSNNEKRATLNAKLKAITESKILVATISNNINN